MSEHGNRRCLELHDIGQALASAPPHRGSPVARQIADDAAGYLGADPAPLAHPLAIDAAGVR